MEQTLRRVGKVAGLEAGVVQPIVPCSEIFNYRNKTAFNFSYKLWLPPVAGDDEDTAGTVVKG